MQLAQTHPGRSRELALVRGLRSDESRNLALERRVELLLLRNLRLDVALRGGALRDELRLRVVRALQDLAAVLGRCAEVLHLRKHICVGLRHRLRVVDPRDHVVKALRAENDLERRFLIRRVQRNEALRDRALPDLEVVLRDAQLTPVLTHVALDLRQLRTRCVVLRPRALERIGQLREPRHDLLRLGPFRRHRGVGERGDCDQKGQTDPGENVRRLSQPTNDDPRTGDGTGAPVGAGASRGGSVPASADKRQSTTCANVLFSTPGRGFLLPNYGTVRPSCLGRHTRRGGGFCRLSP